MKRQRRNRCRKKLSRAEAKTIPKAVMLVVKHEVSFEFYFNVFCGGKAGIIPAGSFERCFMLARQTLNYYMNSSVTLNGFDEDIRFCICELAEVMFCAEKTGDVKSESIDGYSVTFADRADVRDKCRTIILQRLGNSGLLYAGVE